MSVKNKRLASQRSELHRQRRIRMVAAVIGMVVCVCIYLHYEMALKFVEATSAIYGICELLLE